MLELPEFPILVHKFLAKQLHPDTPGIPLIQNDGKIRVFYSATAIFRAPSDPSGIRSMQREQIRTTPSWRNGAPRYDCAFINSGSEDDPLRGLIVGRIFLFFTFVHKEILYSCALIQWYSFIGNEPDEDTGMWMVKPDIHSDSDSSRRLAVVHIDSIYRAAHLMPAYRTSRFIDRSLGMHESLNTFTLFYINKFADHNAFEIAS
jgi:hypothetical protein